MKPKKQNSNFQRSEFDLIKTLVEYAPASSKSLVTGAGDDCAIFTSQDGNSSFVATVDTLVDNVHFKRSYLSFEDIGWKSLAASLSDVASMGATPKFFLISLQRSPEISDANLESLYSGMKQLAKQEDVLLLGGDTVSSETFAVSITFIGESFATPFLRSGAEPDDILFLAGSLGEAAAGLGILNNEIQPEQLLDAERCLAHHRRPKPLTGFIKSLRDEKLICTSMIDVSDGLFQDATHLAEMSAVDIIIEAKNLKSPFEREVNKSLLYSILSGGDDYALLFTSTPEFRAQLNTFQGISEIGRVLPKSAASGRVHLALENGSILESHEFMSSISLKSGYQHF